jgi:hypothetical protein
MITLSASRLVRLLIAGVCVLYPKQVAQWFVALIVAGVAAYLTTGGKLAPFELWFVIDYILIQVIVAMFNNRHKLEKV